jgi:hypothetical protein
MNAEEKQKHVDLERKKVLSKSLNDEQCQDIEQRLAEFNGIITKANMPCLVFFKHPTGVILQTNNFKQHNNNIKKEEKDTALGFIRCILMSVSYMYKDQVSAEEIENSINKIIKRKRRWNRIKKLFKL